MEVPKINLNFNNKCSKSSGARNTFNFRTPNNDVSSQKDLSFVSEQNKTHAKIVTNDLLDRINRQRKIGSRTSSV